MKQPLAQIVFGKFPRSVNPGLIQIMDLVRGFDCSAQSICNWFKSFEQMRIRDLSFHQMSGIWLAIPVSVMLDQSAP
jgi:hypothetical protein